MSGYNSEISGFYKLPLKKHRELLSKLIKFNENDIKLLEDLGYFTEAQIDSLIENVIGSFQLPIGIACNFKVNNKDYLIPMVIEEPSVVAAASKAAKIARKHGGYQSEDVQSVMISQI